MLRPLDIPSRVSRIRMLAADPSRELDRPSPTYSIAHAVMEAIRREADAALVVLKTAKRPRL
jgi:hypothetical protein